MATPEERFARAIAGQCTGTRKIALKKKGAEGGRIIVGTQGMHLGSPCAFCSARYLPVPYAVHSFHLWKREIFATLRDIQTVFSS